MRTKENTERVKRGTEYGTHRRVGDHNRTMPAALDARVLIANAQAARGCTASDLAREIGVSPSHLSNAKSGRFKLSTDALKRLRCIADASTEDAAPTTETGERPDYEACGSKFTTGEQGDCAGNAEFMRAVFHTLPESAAPVVAAFEGDPNAQPQASWRVEPVIDTLPPILRSGTNQYFSIASVTQAPSGGYSRKHPAAVHCLVIDDIGTNGKVDPESVTLPPSWELETSPDNAQQGYILEEPITDLGLFRRVLAALKAKGYTDPNGNNPVRLARLPEGVNCKPAVVEHHGEPFPCSLHQWAPERRYTLAELVERLGLDVEPAKPESGIDGAAEAPAPVDRQSGTDWDQATARKLAWDAARRTIDDPDLGRHAEAYRLGCYAARDGLPPAALDFILREFAEHMRPCDTSGVVSGINWEKEQGTIRDGYRDGRRDKASEPRVDVSELLNQKAPQPSEDATEGQEQRKGPVFGFVHVAALLDEPSPLRWLVRDYLPPDSQALLFGDPATGKSLVAIDWAACIATGRPWCGFLVAQGPVFYLAGEGHRGISMRLKAWAQHHGCESELREAPLVVSRMGAALTETAGLQAVIEAGDKAAAAMGSPALIVIDTLHRNFGAADENSAADMAAFVQAADALRNRYDGCTVLTVHHSGHGDKGRARGSSALRAAVDAELRMESDATGIRTLSCPAKMKDAPPPAPLNFALEVLELPWRDADGELVTSVVLTPTEGSTATRQRKAPPGLRVAFESLLAALDTTGEAPPAGLAAEPAPSAVVALDAWRSEFYSRHTGDSAEAKKKAFQRARADLVKGYAAGCRDDLYWSTATNPGCAWADLTAMEQARSILKTAKRDRGHDRDIDGTCPAGQPGHTGHTLKGVSRVPPRFAHAAEGTPGHLHLAEVFGTPLSANMTETLAYL